jgi:hypothetical protein
MACHGVISAGIKVPESLVGPSWRLRHLQFPTTPARAPAGFTGVYIGAGEGNRILVVSLEGFISIKQFCGLAAKL